MELSELMKNCIELMKNRNDYDMPLSYPQREARRRMEACPHKDQHNKYQLIATDDMSPITGTRLFVCRLCGARLDISRKLDKPTITNYIRREG